MHVLSTILGLFQVLAELDDELQPRMEDLIRRYYAFLNNPLRRNGTKALRLCREKDSMGRIRYISWARRNGARGVVNGRLVRFVDRLRGRLRTHWVYRFERDWAGRKAFRDFDRERVALNSARRLLVKYRGALVKSLAYRWKGSVTDGTRIEAQSILIRNQPAVGPQDFDALCGALIFSRTVCTVEIGLGQLVGEFRERFMGYPEIDFAPLLSSRDSGWFRLSWVTKADVVGAGRVLMNHIPGRPTDKWMRARRIGPARRKEVCAFIKLLLPLQNRYSKFVSYLTPHVRRIHSLRTRVRCDR